MSDTSTDTSYRVTADELRQFIERIERLDAEKSWQRPRAVGMTPKSCAK